MDTTAPTMLLERQLKSILDEKLRARNNNGVIWFAPAFKQADEMIAQYRAAISLLDQGLPSKLAGLKEQSDFLNKFAEAQKPHIALTQLKVKIISKLQNDDPNKTFMIRSNKSYTNHELIQEIIEGTEVGNDLIDNIVLLTVDLIMRDKEKI